MHHTESGMDAQHILDADLRPLKRAEYDRLVSLGAFEGERVELLYGRLVAMSPQDPKHTSPISQLNRLLVRALLDRATVRVQSPYYAVDESEPEPDLAVVPEKSYKAAHPERAYLVVEVAVSSAKKDRMVKGPLYARSGVEEYWLVDVTNETVEVYRDPSPEGFATMTRFGVADTLTVAAFADVTVSVAAIFA